MFASREKCDAGFLTARKRKPNVPCIQHALTYVQYVETKEQTMTVHPLNESHADDQALTADETSASLAVARILRFIGEDPTRDGLIDTPKRVVRAWKEMTAGYDEDPAEILSRTFEEESDELVVLRGISFYSTCEHHMLPFYGTASVGYLPGRVVGISKLARLVHCFARRLQIQERLTRQIGAAVEEHLEAKGVGVIVSAHHLCMGCRGVRQPQTEMITSSMLGRLRKDAVSRSEFLRLCQTSFQ
jgi:GTP cyclohydrolase IA